MLEKNQNNFLFYIECFLFIMSFMYLAKTVTDLKWYVGIGFLFKAFKCIHWIVLLNIKRVKTIYVLLGCLLSSSYSVCNLNNASGRFVHICLLHHNDDISRYLAALSRTPNALNLKKICDLDLYYLWCKY